MKYHQTIHVEALASGSSGNVTLLRSGASAILIDAGLGPRTITTYLNKRHVAGTQLQAILLTHEHTDHAQGAAALSRRTQAPLIANQATLEAISLRGESGFESQALPTGCERRVGDFLIRSFAVSHDAVDPVGYVIESAGVRIAYFTDSGCVTPAMRSALRGAQLMIVEANHDVDWLMRGPYTMEMKTRVASETGHLSNSDCADLLAERLEEGGSCCIWLAHLSRVNNSPALARRSIMKQIQQQTHVPFSLEVALRDQPSVVWTPGLKAVQLALL